MNRTTATALAAALALAGAACDASKARPIEPIAQVDDCTRCHGYPPEFIAGGAAHTTSTQCSVCHPGTVEADNVTIVPGGLHMNGVVDANGGAAHVMPYVAGHPAAALANLASCTACHGADYAGGDVGVSCNACHAAVTGSGPDWKTNCTFCHGTRTAGVTTATARAAPPQAVDGTATGQKVGAHQAHLGPGTVANAMACESCHAVPAGAQALTHFNRYDGSAADVTFANSALATKGAGAPTYTGGTCAVYCHGAGTEFGSPANKTSPAWTATGVTCTTCHGNPPASGPTISGQDAHAFHGTTNATCATCHGTGYSTSTVNKATHVDGTKDVVASAAWDCSACHAALGVQVAHPLPFVNDHTSAALSSIASCTACHGTDYNGGTAQSCTACHVSRALVGGGEWTTNCTFCHGTRTAGVTTATTKSAPPQAVDGTTTGQKVGAHQAHLVQGSIAGAMACASCHAVPAGAQALTHFNAYDGSAADVTFASSAFAAKGVTGATYSGGTCAVYCHGTGSEFGSPAGKTSPAWTSTAAPTCTTCHGYPPASHDPSSTNCNACHSGTVDANNTTIKVAGGLHVNGVKEATSAHPAGWGDKTQHGYSVNATGLESCKSCHGATLAGGSGRACSSCHDATVPSWDTSCTFCHGNRSTGKVNPPVDTQGRSVVTNVSVGVHASHVGTTMATPLTCAQCHPARSGSVITDASHIDGDGIAEVSMGALARTGGAAATYARQSAISATCASVYCHGRFTGGVNSGAGATMSWTSTTAVTCTSCHGNPPSTGQHWHAGRAVNGYPAITCTECHGNSGSGATHVNGTKNVPFPGISGASWNGSSCGTFSCHGQGHPGYTW